MLDGGLASLLHYSAGWSHRIQHRQCLAWLPSNGVCFLPSFDSKLAGTVLEWENVKRVVNVLILPLALRVVLVVTAFLRHCSRLIEVLKVISKKLFFYFLNVVCSTNFK